MKSAFTHWADLEAARDDSLLVLLLFRHSAKSLTAQEQRLATSP